MSWSTTITIRCDARRLEGATAPRCDYWADARNVNTPEQARECLARDGWTVENGEDRCLLHRQIPRTIANILLGR